MPTEPDLSAMLPAAPPPRPDRRETTMAAAMRRFDGKPVEPGRPARSGRWRLRGRPQFGALVAAALVAAVGLPLWLSGENRTPMPTAVRHESATTGDQPAPTAMDAAPALEPAGPPAVTATKAEQAPSAPADRAINQPAGRAVADNADAVAAPAPPPPPPPPPPAPPAVAYAPPAALDVAPAPMAEMPHRDGDEANEAGEIVVTGSRISRAAKAQQRIARRIESRGAWNACTVDDPRQDLAACRSALPTTAPGTAGQAKSLVADGVTKAWRDDLDGAVSTFDRAIAASPKLGEAWLNRGLAHVRAGEDAAALGDFDKAVRYAPRDARGWFHRSLVLRRQGKIARADDDAARAIALDPSYERLID